MTSLREIGAGKVTFREDVEAVVKTFVTERKASDGERRRANTRQRAGAL